MTTDLPPRIDMNRMVWGVVLIAVGILFTLDRTGLLDAGGFHDYWPVIPIVFGVARVVTGRGGYWLIVMGVWLLLNELHILSYHTSWPLVLIVLGVYIVWRALAGPPIRPSSSAEN